MAFVTAIASVLERCAIGCEGWAAWQCMTEFPSSGFAAQTGEGGKIKGWDEKEATDNELLGNAFSGAMSFVIIEGQAG